MVESLLQEHAATTLLAFRPRNFGKNIVSDEGTLIGCPKTSKWSDLLMAVPRWFAQFGPCGRLCSKGVFALPGYRPDGRSGMQEVHGLSEGSVGDVATTTSCRQLRCALIAISH